MLTAASSEFAELNERISTVVRRFNDLVKGFDELEQHISSGESNVSGFSEDIKKSCLELKKNIDLFSVMVSEAEKKRQQVKSEFKSILKKDQFARLERRINSLNYESFIGRNELNRLIDK